MQGNISIIPIGRLNETCKGIHEYMNTSIAVPTVITISTDACKATLHYDSPFEAGMPPRPSLHGSNDDGT